jgi:cellulose 1,4-beta-cellobiosidase
VRRTVLAGGLAAAVILATVVPGPAAAARPDTRPPTAPSGLRVSDVTQTGFTLTWTASTDNVRVTSYAAWGAGTPVAYTTAPATSATFTGLRPGTTYAVRVQATDGRNWSAASPDLPVATRPDVAAPTAPGPLRLSDTAFGLPVDGVTASAALVSWTNAADDFGPVRYEVLVDGRPNPDVYSVRPAGSPSGTFATAWVRRLAPGTTHALSVRAVDAAGNASAPSAPLTVTTEESPDTVAPTAPG